MMGLTRSDSVSILPKYQSSRSLSTASSLSTTKRSSSMRELFRRVSGLSATTEGSLSMVSHAGGYDDMYPSVDVQVFDKDELEETERTCNETTSTDDCPASNDIVLREVPPSAVSVSPSPVPQQKKKKKRTANRRGSTGTTTSSRPNAKIQSKTSDNNLSAHKKKLHKSARKEEAQPKLFKSRSDRCMLTKRPQVQRHSSMVMTLSNQPQDNKLNLKESKESCKRTKRRQAVDTKRPKDQTRGRSPLKNRQRNQRGESSDRKLQSPKANNKPSIRSVHPSKRRQHMESTPNDSQRKSRSISPVKRAVGRSSRRRSTSPLMKAQLQTVPPRVPLSSTTVRRRNVSPPKQITVRRESIATTRGEDFTSQKSSNILSFLESKLGMSDSHLCYYGDNNNTNHDNNNDSKVPSSDTSVAWSNNLSVRRLSSRHPRRRAAAMDSFQSSRLPSSAAAAAAAAPERRRVAPQRSRSLTDLRDMLRPKSDPRHKPRCTSVERDRGNPLDLYFSSQVTVAPPAKDSMTMMMAPPSPTAKRPLARRLERHKMFHSTQLRLEALDAEETKVKPDPTPSVVTFDRQSHLEETLHKSRRYV